MKHQAKVSVVIPVCNVENDLPACLQSVKDQTLQDIEIICVDDGSTDRSSEILETYAAADARFVVLSHKENLSTSQARKDGVLASRGKYVMFLDGDDTLLPDACETAYQGMETWQTDMLQFGTQIINCGGISEKRIASNEKLLRPCLAQIRGEHLLFSCWKEKRFGFTLWNKIYKGELCRKAFQYIQDGAFPKAQDLYAFFVIAYFSKSYQGISKPLYQYHFGRGITGGDCMNLETYQLLLTEHRVAEAVRNFVRDQGNAPELLKICGQIRKDFLNECVTKWLYQLNREFWPEGFRQLTSLWGFKDVLCSLAGKHWFERDVVAERILETGIFQRESRVSAGELKTIAIYYHSIKNGGAQRVAAKLSSILAEMKDEKGALRYQILLLTDAYPQDTGEAPEYPVDAAVIRETLPLYSVYTEEKYQVRYDAWMRILDQYDIDVVISGMWVAPCNLWDMLAVKGHVSRPAFVIHTHSFTCLPFQFPGNAGSEFVFNSQIADGVVVLSDCDRIFLSAFTPCVRHIVNPLSVPEAGSFTVRQEPHAVVWVGRLSREKQPLDAVRMMEYVVREVPDAKLYLVGSGEEAYVEQLKAWIELLDLKEHVVLTGFTQDVAQYYCRASVLVSTSAYEGFGMVYGEAMSYRLPVVSYDMPWLTFMQDGRGILPVQKDRVDLLAREVIRLLRHPEERKRIGAEGRALVEEYAKVDVGGAWRGFLEELLQGKPVTVTLDPRMEILFHYLVEFQRIGKSTMQRKLQDAYQDKTRRGEEVRYWKRKYEKLFASRSYKVGSILLWLPRVLKNKVKKIRRQGA